MISSLKLGFYLKIPRVSKISLIIKELRLSLSNPSNNVKEGAFS